MQTLSRRQALSAVGRAAAVIVATGGRAVALPVGDDAALFAMHADMMEAHAATLRAGAHSSAVEDVANKLTPPRPVPGVKPDCPTEDICAALLASFNETGAAPSPALVALHEFDAAEKARMETWLETCRQISEQCGVDQAADEFSARIDAEIVLAHRLVALPAATMAGVLLKLSIREIENGEWLDTKCDLEADDDEDDDEDAGAADSLRTPTLGRRLLASIAADLERMEAQT